MSAMMLQNTNTFEQVLPVNRVIMPKDEFSEQDSSLNLGSLQTHHPSVLANKQNDKPDEKTDEYEIYRQQTCNHEESYNDGSFIATAFIDINECMERCDQNVNCQAFRHLNSIHSRCDMYSKCNDRQPTEGYSVWIKTDLHKGMVKYGEHWYKETNYMINPIDRFADEFNESVEELQWAGQEVGWWYEEASEVTDTIGLMLKGFQDNGNSFELGIAVARRDGLIEWISPETMKLLMGIDLHLMKNNFDIQAFALQAYYWFLERIVNAVHRSTLFGVARFIMFAVEYLFLLGFTQDGKISIFSPRIFGVIPIAILGFVSELQLVWNTWINKWWAKGNIFILMDHCFAIIQVFFALLDINNIQLYQYTFRFVRYLSFFASINYLFFYTIIASVAYELMGQKDPLKEEQDRDAVMDIILSMVALNSLPTFGPTAIINLIIFLKELTMNQFAWAKNEDFETGRVPILGFNVDLLYWAGFDRNLDDYNEVIREFTKTYL